MIQPEKTGVFGQKVSARTKNGVFRQKVTTRTKTGMFGQKVSTQTKTGGFRPKVSNRTKTEASVQKQKYYFKKGSIRTTTELLGTKPSASKKKPPSSPKKTCFNYSLWTKDFTRIGPGTNPEPRREMQATDRLDNARLSTVRDFSVKNSYFLRIGDCVLI